MSLSKRRHRMERVMYSKLTLAFLLLCSILLSFSVYERYTKAKEMEEKKQESESSYNDLSERKEQLKKKVDYLEGKQGIESEIRRNFDVVKEGEEVVIIVDNDSSSGYHPREVEKEPEEKKSFWSKWLTW